MKNLKIYSILSRDIQLVIIIIIYSFSININMNINTSSIVTNNVVNRSIGENRVNISNFLNECSVNIYVTWYRLYDFTSWWKEIRQIIFILINSVCFYFL